MGCKSFDVIGFDLGHLLQGQMRIAKLKVLITRLLLVLEVCDVKPTYRKSCFWWGQIWPWIPPSRLNVVLYTYDGLYLPYYWSYRFWMWRQLMGHHVPRIFCWGQIWPWIPPSRSNVVLVTYNGLYLPYYYLWRFGCEDNLQEVMYP